MDEKNKYTGMDILDLAQMAPDGSLILTAALLSVATNSGSTITQMVQVYGGDAEYSLSLIHICASPSTAASKT